ncbi:MAG: adenylyltransferase/cytidyltransferase family protein [Candidatus Shapirobacteria bacterium]
MKKPSDFDKIEITSLDRAALKIVLVGGCFDIVHLGHLIFLEKAKAKGDILIVLLESDENIKKNKGQNRPINNQENRAVFLTKLKMVDYVIKLPEMKNDEEYLEIIKKLKPEIIAVSENDNNLEKKMKQANEVGAKVLEVSKSIPHQSTSLIIDKIKI